MGIYNHKKFGRNNISYLYRKLKIFFKTESSGILKFQFYNNSKKYKVSLHSASFCFSSKLPRSVTDTLAEERRKKENTSGNYFNTLYF